MAERQTGESLLPFAFGIPVAHARTFHSRFVLRDGFGHHVASVRVRNPPGMGNSVLRTIVYSEGILRATENDYLNVNNLLLKITIGACYLLKICSYDCCRN